MLTNLQRGNKRLTRLTRVNADWHCLVKAEANRRGVTMSRLHDDIYEFYFSNFVQKENSNNTK